VTIFILIAVILIASVILFFVFKSNPTDAEILSSSDPAYIFLSSCLEQTSENALSALGWQGGLINFSEERMMITYFSTITYAYDETAENPKTLPRLEEMENELETYVNFEFKNCLENKDALQGWEVKNGEIKTDVFSTDDSVMFNIDSPLTLTKNQTAHRIKKLHVEIPVRLSYLHYVISDIVDVQVNMPGWVPFTYLNEFDVNVTFYPYRENNFIYEFTDEKSVIDNEPYRFLVANRWKERSEEEINKMLEDLGEH